MKDLGVKSNITKNPGKNLLGKTPDRFFYAIRHKLPGTGD